MDKLSIYKTLAERANQGDLIFPTNVRETIKLKRQLDDPDCHLDQAAKLIAADPLLAARAVALANSVAYRRSASVVTNVRSAVQRLGFRTLITLLSAMIVRQMNAQLKNPDLQKIANKLWEHSAHVASLAQIIAKNVTRVDAETAFFAGIVHEVGGFYLISQAETYPGLLEGDSEIWMDYGEKVIGRGVLKALEVPEAVLHGVEYLWQGITNMPPESLGDTLILANDIAPVASPLESKARLQLQNYTRHIDFEVDDTTLQEILDETDSETQSLTQALMT